MKVWGFVAVRGGGWGNRSCPVHVLRLPWFEILLVEREWLGSPRFETEGERVVELEICQQLNTKQEIPSDSHRVTRREPHSGASESD